ncbi:unnamed protein product, partial [Amoebophrya sp. A25]|eukprot:GSA25T00006704001.1
MSQLSIPDQARSGPGSRTDSGPTSSMEGSGKASSASDESNLAEQISCLKPNGPRYWAQEWAKCGPFTPTPIVFCGAMWVWAVMIAP